MINLSGVRSSAVEDLEMAHGISGHSIGNAEQLLLLDDRLGELGAGLDGARPRERGVEMVGNPLVDLVDDERGDRSSTSGTCGPGGAERLTRPPRPRDRLDYPLHIPGLLPVGSGTKTRLGTIRSPSHEDSEGWALGSGRRHVEGAGSGGDPPNCRGSGHRRLPQPLTQGRLVEHLDQPLRQLRGVVRVEGQPRLPDDLRLRGVPAHDHQRPAVHRLEDRQAEALVERWEDERGTVPVKQPQRLVGDPVQQQE